MFCGYKKLFARARIHNGHLMILSHEFPNSLFMVSRLHLQSYFCDLSDVLPRVKAVSTFSFSKKHAGFFSDITTNVAPHVSFSLCVLHRLHRLLCWAAWV